MKKLLLIVAVLSIDLVVGGGMIWTLQSRSCEGIRLELGQVQLLGWTPQLEEQDPVFLYTATNGFEWSAGLLIDSPEGNWTPAGSILPKQGESIELASRVNRIKVIITECGGSYYYTTSGVLKSRIVIREA